MTVSEGKNCFYCRLWGKAMIGNNDVNGPHAISEWQALRDLSCQFYIDWYAIKKDSKIVL